MFISHTLGRKAGFTELRVEWSGNVADSGHSTCPYNGYLMWDAQRTTYATTRYRMTIHIVMLSSSIYRYCKKQHRRCKCSVYPASKSHNALTMRTVTAVTLQAVSELNYVHAARCRYGKVFKTSCGARHNKPRPCCHLANNASRLSYGR